MADLEGEVSEVVGEVRLIRCDKYQHQISFEHGPVKAKDICLKIDSCDEGINLRCPYWIKLNRKV